MHVAGAQVNIWCDRMELPALLTLLGLLSAILWWLAGGGRAPTGVSGSRVDSSCVRHANHRHCESTGGGGAPAGVPTAALDKPKVDSDIPMLISFDPQAEAAHRRAFLAAVASHQKDAFRPTAALAIRRRAQRTAAMRAWHTKCADCSIDGSSGPLQLRQSLCNSPVLAKR